MLSVFTWPFRRMVATFSGMLALIVLLTAQSPLPPEKQNITPTEEAGIPYVTLEGFAYLSADTFAAGPPSGTLLAGTINGRTFPFESQVVQGISAILPHWNGNYLIMPDNGFGTRENSADVHLRWYEAAMNFYSGRVDIVGYTELSDPNGLVPWPIVHEQSRVLTGADFDPESFQQAPDGTLWFGDEFGPYLLHTDATGQLIDPPFSLPYPPAFAQFARGRAVVQSPDNADFRGLPSDEERAAAANIPSSRGIEGMAINVSKTRLYPILEAPLVDDFLRTRLLIREFDLGEEEYTDDYWFYQLNDPSHAIGDMVAIDDREFLVIERGRQQGEDADFKRIYRIDLDDAARFGVILPKTLVADLIHINNHQQQIIRTWGSEFVQGTVGLDPDFSFPFISVEGLHIIDDRTLLIVNDNNYPFGSARRPGEPDGTEFIVVKVPESLGVQR